MPEIQGEFTLSQAIGTYYSDVSQHQSSARTTLSQGRAILDVMAGGTMLSKLTQAEIARFVSVRRKDVAVGTINRQLQMLGRAIRYMEKTHGANIASLDLRAAEIKEPKERVRELTRDEQRRLFEQLRADLHPWVKFALMTGARLATICGLRWSDINLDTSRMSFRLKGGDTMPFPINSEMRAFLTSLPRSDEPDHAPYVITYLDQGTKAKVRRKITPSGGISEEFRAALTAAGIDNFRFHDLRHTFATRMLRQTGNIKMVSRLLGHTTIETTTRYAHVLDEDMASAMDDFSALEFGEFQKNPQSTKKRS